MKLTYIRLLIIVAVFLLCFYALRYPLDASAIIALAICYIFEPAVNKPQ